MLRSPRSGWSARRAGNCTGASPSSPHRRWLAGHDQVKLEGPHIDLRLSVKGRTFIEADGKHNFPDGEIFTGPIEGSVHGWVRFAYPAIYGGREVTDIELWFEDGKVVTEKASKGQERLTPLLTTDPGARYLWA